MNDLGSCTKVPMSSEAPFLIYSSITFPEVSKKILIDCAVSEEDAKRKVRVLEKRYAEFTKMYPYGKDDPRALLVYITNKPHWWAANLEIPK